MKVRVWSGRFASNGAALALLLVVLAPPAEAALGDGVASIEGDRRRVGGTLSRSTGAGHLVHEIETPAGSRVREFVSPAGFVFAVAWEGPRIPDLRQLLGAHFEAYSRAAQQRQGRRGPLVLELPGLVFESYGHPRSFRGRAYLPELLPEGVQTDAIR